MKVVVFVAAWLAVLASHAEAQFRYVDKDGVSHWVQTQDQVPPEYRGKIEQPKLPGTEVSKGGGPSATSVRMPPGMTEFTTYNEAVRRFGDPAVTRELGDAIITASHACPAAHELYRQWIQDNWQKYGRRVDWRQMNLHDARTLTQACQKLK